MPYSFGATALDGVVYEVGVDERFWIRMCHHMEVMVGAGDVVHAGQTVALVGSSGKYTTGPHVHVELRKGTDFDTALVLDPLDFFIAAIPGLRSSVLHAWRND